MEFEQDILISYAHIDDQSLIEGERGWISEFHRTLEIRLGQLLGSKPKIWRDEKLQGNDFFGDEIVEQFPNIALLVSILSPRYVNSKWCLKEVAEFQKVASNNIGLRLQNKSRIFKVVKTPVPRDQHPEITQSMLGYDFFGINQETGKVREFGKLFGQESERAYWARLDDLAHDICDLLQEIKQLNQPINGNHTTLINGGPVPKTEQPSEEKKPTVFLANVSYDLREEHDSIHRELEEAGFKVLPKTHLPMLASELEETVEQQLEDCQLCVQLIGGNYGMVPEGSHKSIVELQSEVAARKAQSSDLKRLIWISPDHHSVDDRQSNFIKELRENPMHLEGADLFEDALEDVKFAVHDFLTESAPQEEKPIEESAEKGPPVIYLICDQQDLDDIIDLEDFLFDQGYEVVIPAFDGEESAVRTDHQENLKVCDAAIIYYGHGSELWLRSQTRELLKSSGYGRTKPFAAKAVCIGQPETARKSRFRSHDTLVIKTFDGVNAEVMSPFIQQINLPQTKLSKLGSGTK